MGNRAVITTANSWRNDGVGVYLHWNGGRDSVEAFLKYCELKEYRSPDKDNYGWARLCQVIGNFFGGSTSVGIDTLWHLDCDNYDNGVYIIEGWKIVDRHYHRGEEQSEYDMNEMLSSIDESMPEKEKIGKFLAAEDVEEAAIGDRIVFIESFSGKVREAEVIGIGADRFINGTEVSGIPYLDLYGEVPERNINNYLINKNWRKVK